jgi:Domain of unknown function (DUF5615)
MRLLADENFDGRILEGIRARLPDTDIIRVQDTEIYQAADAIVLEWAAKQSRVLLTHDVQALINDAYSRVKAGLAMPGVIEVQQTTSIRQAIDELEVLIGAGQPEDFENQVKYIPMR